MASDNGSLPHTCEHCQRILLDKPIKKENFGQYEVTLPHFRGDVYEAVQAGCPLFSLYPKFPFFDLSITDSLAPTSWQPFFDPLQFLRFEGWQRRHAWLLAKSMLNPYDRPFQVMYDTEGEFSLRCASWVSKPEIRRVVAPHGNPASDDLLFRPINSRVDTKEVFDFVHAQIRECYQTHCHEGSCPLLQDDFSPRRVIRIDKNGDSLSLRLYQPEAGEAIQWCALSYCWGGQDQSVKTTVATLQDRYHGIDIITLPKTIHDAITTVSRLGLHYVWIDSLCIVQDDRQEMTQDIADMDRIYSHAYFTLSASSASNVSEGFLHDRVILKSSTPVSLRYISESGAEGNLIVCSEPAPADMPDPINSRAWTFQERVLSPRLVDFSTTQVRWRCNSAQKSESGCPPKSAWKNHFETSFIVGKAQESQRRTQEIQQEWNGLVTGYSNRDLTYAADKLVAFSAIPKTFGRSGKYLAGLWEVDLPCNLLWKVCHVWFPIAGTIDKRKPRPNGCRAPSWSWASVDGSVECEVGGIESWLPEAACQVLECEVSLADESVPYGAVTSGHIVIKGNVRQATFFPLTSELFFYDVGTVKGDAERAKSHYQGFADCKPGEASTEHNPSINVWCLHIRNFGGRGEGLLLVRDEGEDVFRRIGHFYWGLQELGNSFEHSEGTVLRVD
ncbi:HET-domain-containing [Fusarium albosuccineum]|uniref:HET-domain-containing n=1 Tax=Fusarium albosuccineum TaxID=1237068 RepID=A0A8H4PI20_9HYPO|nr:HET-domain-containing [Fusarium albosuccineum]